MFISTYLASYTPGKTVDSVAQVPLQGMGDGILIENTPMTNTKSKYNPCVPCALLWAQIIWSFTCKTDLDMELLPIGS